MTRACVLTVVALASAGSMASPVIIISQPTSASTYSAATANLTVSGTALGSTPITAVTWACATCKPSSGTASSSGSVPVDWLFHIGTLGRGSNAITVTARDADGHTGVDEIAVVYAPSDTSSPIVTITGRIAAIERAPTGMVDLTGICTDNTACTEVLWSRTGGAGGRCTATAQWTCRDVALVSGLNVLTVTGQDAAGNTGSDTITVTSNEPLSITTVSMPAAARHAAYTRALSADGGMGTEYVWASAAGGSGLGSGACSGLSISASGFVSGTPTTTGPCSFTVRVNDSEGNAATRTLTIQVSHDRTEGSHDYFNTLKALPEVHPIANCRSMVPDDNGACSLRDQNQLDALTPVASPNVNPNGFVYVYGSDSYRDPQDAAKLVLTPCPHGCSAGSGSIAGNQNVIMPLGGLNTGTILITWDAWFGPEWRQPSCGGNIGSQTTLKTFQIRGGERERGHIYFETRHRFRSAATCDDVGAHDNRVYPNEATKNFPGGLTDEAPYAPTGKNAQPPNTYPIKHSTWSRYIAYIELTKAGRDPTFADWRQTYLGAASTVGNKNPASDAGEETHPDRWHALTMWICDEARDCTRVLWRAPWKVQNPNGTLRNLTEFHSEFNTSAAANLRTGEVVAYIRNWVALRNYAMDMSGADSAEDIANNPTMLKRPVR